MGMAGQVELPLRLGELLDGVTEHGAGHGLVARKQIRLQGRFIFLAGFAEEPADGFVDEVVGVMEEDVGDGEGVVELAVADKSHCADDTDTLLPKGFAVVRQVIEQRAVLIEQPFAEQGVAR